MVSNSGRATHKMLADTQTLEFGQRVSFACKTVWPNDTAKHAARAANASPRTAERWLSGAAPENRHWLALIRHFGPRLTAFVLQPVAPWAAAWEASAELIELNNEIDRVKARLEELKNRAA